MESLIFVVSVLWVCLLLTGPTAVLLHHAKFPLLAALAAVIAIWLGLFWFVHVVTPARYIGACSVACGLYVVWRTAHRI